MSKTKKKPKPRPKPKLLEKSLDTACWGINNDHWVYRRYDSNKEA